MGTVDGSTDAIKDQSAIGSIFIGVLFAAVITKTLDLSTASTTTSTGKVQLALAAVLTIASYLGYHNSRNRVSYGIHFFNLPLARFTVEMSLLYLYWLMATTAEQIKRGSPSALPEAALIALTFALYVCWDQIVVAMRKSHRYAELRISDDRPRRRHVTVGFLALFALLVGPSVIARSNAFVVVLDVLFAILVITHRAVQHRVSDPPRMRANP